MECLLIRPNFGSVFDVWCLSYAQVSLLSLNLNFLFQSSKYAEVYSVSNYFTQPMPSPLWKQVKHPVLVYLIDIGKQLQEIQVIFSCL